MNLAEISVQVATSCLFGTKLNPCEKYVDLSIKLRLALTFKLFRYIQPH